MTVIFACEVVLALLLVAIATWTIVARTAFTAIVVFMVYGLLLAIAWVALSAVDVALTEAAIGGGVTSIVLLGAASRLRGSKAAAPSVSFPFKIMAGVLCVIVAAGLAAVVFSLPDIAPTLAPVAKENSGGERSWQSGGGRSFRFSRARYIAGESCPAAGSGRRLVVGLG